MSTDSTEKTPQLPENTTARQLLDEYSDRARAEMAQQQGISVVAFNKYLNGLARQERVAESVSQAKEVLQKKEESAERNENHVVAEQAIIRGLKKILQNFSPEYLAEEVIDELERQAYAAVEELGALPYWSYEAERKRKKLDQMFERIVAARTLNDIAKNMRDGVTETDARKAAVESLKEQAQRTNLNVLRRALEDASMRFEEGYVTWRGRETTKMPELQSLVDGYGTRPLTPQESTLLTAFLKAAKSHYFTGVHPDFSGILRKYRRMMGVVFVTYRNYGPHKRTSSNVSGPAETFTSYQSEREAGYRRVGKARPHRDPSGGAGEKW